MIAVGVGGAGNYASGGSLRQSERWSQRSQLFTSLGAIVVLDGWDRPITSRLSPSELEVP